MNNGSVYLWETQTPHPFHGRIVKTITPLLHLDSDGEGRGRLWGRFVRVCNHGVAYEPDGATSNPHPAPIGDAQPNDKGDFIFDPGRGGGRMDIAFCVETGRIRSLLLESSDPPRWPEFRKRYIQAAHFGEVNTYYHIDSIAAYINELLGELGESSLPPVLVVVNAHHALNQIEGVSNGVRRGNGCIAFQGGHYRLPGRQIEIPEPPELSPNGEIHIGPGRQLLKYGALVEAAGGFYRANASHNAGILYHEYGHHINRHTADFRANALRLPDQQVNRKTALDEGSCDYWAATILGSPHIWAWHQRHDDEVTHPRSLISSKTMADYDFGKKADPHTNGTIWAAALWDLRSQFVANCSEGARSMDRLLLMALLLMGRLEGGIQPPTVATVCHAREGFKVGLAALIQADERLYAGRHSEMILAKFARRGIHLQSHNGTE